MNNKQTINTNFQGFEEPSENWFKLPNIWTDITSGMSSFAELKVVEYVLRHTWGFHEFGKMKKITLDEFENGRKKSNGTRMDKGIGMRKQAIISGLRQAVKDGYLIEEVDKSDKGRIRKFYGLKMLHLGSIDEGGEGESKQRYENHTSGVRQSHSRTMKYTPPSEKETYERNLRKTVNGDVKLIRNMTNLNIPDEQADYIADYILEELGDKHSAKFYKLVSRKVPEGVIRQTISEIKADGANDPRKVFTFRMNKYALSSGHRATA